MSTPYASGSRNNAGFVRGVVVGAPFGAPLPRILSGAKEDRRTRRLTKTRADDGWLVVIPGREQSERARNP
jgi:hypothetical protein